MPFQLEDGSGLVVIESIGELWLENDAASSGIKWPRCCCGGMCTQDFRISCDTQILGSVTINVYVSNGGELLATGTTTANQSLALSWSGSCDVYVTALSSGTTFYAQSLSLTSGGTTTVGVTTGVDVICCSNVAVPKSDIHFTASAPGCTPSTYSGTFIYDSGAWSYNFGFYTITCDSIKHLVFTSTPWATCVVPLTILSGNPFSAQVVLTTTNCLNLASSGCSEQTWTFTL